MVIDIKMCRFENVPWGFRLVGGSDFEFPLTVVKVIEGSIAEQAGMQVGDVIVRVNDTAISPLTHDETGQVINNCGNVFYFGIQRENEEESLTPKVLPLNDNSRESSPVILEQTNDQNDNEIEEECLAPKAFPLTERISSPKSFLEVSAEPIPNPTPVVVEPAEDQENEYEDDFICEQEDRPCSVLSDDTERKMVENEIAAVLSGESEVLKEHNTLGVNFYRLFPKPGVCMSSDVLRSLNEEAIKTKAEKDKENRKWTTFLQKPDRPIPKSKASIEAERRAANAYKVTIVTPRSRSASPAPASLLAEAEKPKEPTPPPQEEPEPEPEPEPEAPTPIDTEVPNLEETSTVEAIPTDAEQQESEKTDREKELTPEAEESASPVSEESIAASVVECTLAEKIDAKPIEKSEEELALEQQLADVQRQLAALSSLPSTIQSTLDAVTRQLADLIPTFKLQQERRASSASIAREISLENVAKDHETDDENKDIKQNDNDAENCHESVENGGTNTTTTAGSRHQQHELDNKANEQIANDTNEARDTIDKNPIKQQEGSTNKSHSSNEETLQMEEEQKLKKTKATHTF